MKIETLTPEQESKLSLYRDKWLKIGLSTEPLDFERAKAAATKCYELAGLNPPQYFLHFQSPYAAAIGAHSHRKRFKKGGQVSDRVWDQVHEQIRDQVGVQASNQVRDQVKAHVQDQVEAHVWDQVGAHVGAQVGAQVRNQVKEKIRHQLWDQVWAQIFGPHDANFLSYYDFFQSELNLINCEKIDGLIELANHCGWWAPYENVCILQDRPSIIKFDDKNRAHCEDGPAIAYPDGFGVYCWHGTRIPADWIEQAPSAEEALEWENLEQRRAACEIVGWHNILRELDARTIHKDEDPQIGELVEVNIPDIGNEKFLRVLCGTGREFALPVPPEMTTALQANAWTYGLASIDYKPEIRT